MTAAKRTTTDSSSATASSATTASHQNAPSTAERARAPAPTAAPQRYAIRVRPRISRTDNTASLDNATHGPGVHHKEAFEKGVVNRQMHGPLRVLPLMHTPHSSGTTNYASWGIFQA